MRNLLFNLGKVLKNQGNIFLGREKEETNEHIKAKSEDVSSEFQVVINKAMKDGTAFLRAIRYPSRLCKDSIFPETNSEKEIRKIKREIGAATRTKEVATKAGNRIRSTTMAGYSSMSFSSVGVGLINPQPNHIYDVSSEDLRLGFGKRKRDELGYEENKDENLDKVKKQLETVRNNVRNDVRRYTTEKQELCNEILLNINKDNVGFVFYNPTSRVMYPEDFNYNVDLKKLLAVYIQRDYQIQTGKLLPIVEYNPILQSYEVKKFSDTEIKKILLEAYKESPGEFRGPHKLRLAEFFMKEIKEDKYLSDGINEAMDIYISEPECSQTYGVNSILSIAKIMMKYNDSDTTKNFLMANLDYLLTPKNLASYSEICTHSNKNSKIFMTVIDSIEKIAGTSFISKNTETIQNNFVACVVKDMCNAKSNDEIREILEKSWRSAKAKNLDRDFVEKAKEQYKIKSDSFSFYKETFEIEDFEIEESMTKVTKQQPKMKSKID